LGHDLATDRTPNVVDAVLTTDFFCVIQRYGTVAISDDEDMFLRKDLLRSYERGADDVGGFVLGRVSA
jgi:hypothetical protein